MSSSWYIVKQAAGQCEIVAQDAQDAAPEQQTTPKPDNHEVWGPFASQGEAIARRVGLIRAGKCQPV